MWYCGHMQILLALAIFMGLNARANTIQPETEISGLVTDVKDWTTLATPMDISNETAAVAAKREVPPAAAAAAAGAVVAEQHNIDLARIDKRLKALLNCDDVQLRTRRIQYDSYWLLQNIVRGELSRNLSCAGTITYATHGDYTYVKHLLPLVKRWLAPISYAIFAPGYDIYDTLEAIQLVRNCFPDSPLIRQYISFHIYFPAAHMPSYVPTVEREALGWYYDCANAGVLLQKALYKTAHHLTYPINVGRNIARMAANTHFVFASDVELIPSGNLVAQFLNMIASEHPNVYSGDKFKRVFTLPIFEIEKNESVPETKTELVKLLKKKRAIPFHWNICKRCHFSPKQAEWTNATDDRELRVFTVSKRQGEFSKWEPIFLSDNREPMFDERLSWEGLSEKRVQNFAMCLLGYEYHVLHPAFLVHSPGIKCGESHKKRRSRLSKYMRPAERIIHKDIIPEYRVFYGNEAKCTV